MPLRPRPCPTCRTGVCEVHRTRCYRCLHPDRPTPVCSCCGSGEHYVSGYCRACHPRLDIAESCRSCLGWTAKRWRGMCNPCYQFGQHHPIGSCLRCARMLPIRDGHCRLCLIHTERLYNPHPLAPPAGRPDPGGPLQLFLADAIHRPTAPIPRPDPGPPAWSRPRYTQPRLCDPPRAMGQVRLREREPVDPPFAAHVLAQLDRLAGLRAWPTWLRNRLAWSVARLVAVHPGDEPIKASSVASLGPYSGCAINHTLRFLAELGLLEDDRPDTLGAWIDKRLTAVHPAIRDEAQVWIDLLRNGAPRARPRSPTTVRIRVDYIAAFLAEMSARHASLREVTTEEITTWLADRRSAAYEIHAIRGLFKALARRRLVFTDPTRALHPGRTQARTPLPLAPEALRKIGAVAATDPVVRIVVALIGIHAMYSKQARELPLDAIDLSRGRLRDGEIDRPLDDYTRQAALDYLAHRHRRWPTTMNPYLLVNGNSAHTGQPVTKAWLHVLFKRLAVTPRQLRDDRVLDEAIHSGGDPMHLVAVFNIGPLAGRRYANALAERTTPDNQAAPRTRGPSTP